VQAQAWPGEAHSFVVAENGRQLQGFLELEVGAVFRSTRCLHPPVFEPLLNDSPEIGVRQF